VLIFSLSLVVVRVIGNFVIFHKIKVAKHIWTLAATWWLKLGANLPFLSNGLHYKQIMIVNDVSGVVCDTKILSVILAINYDA